MIYWKQKGLGDGKGISKKEANDYLNLIEAYEKLDIPSKLINMAKIYGYLLDQAVKARELFDQVTDQYPNNVEAHVEYWRYLFKRKEYSKAKLVAERALQASEAISVPTSLWVETRIIMSKSLLVTKEVEKAIESLKDICFLLPPFPIDDLTFIENVIV